MMRGRNVDYLSFAVLWSRIPAFQFLRVSAMRVDVFLLEESVASLVATGHNDSRIRNWIRSLSSDCSTSSLSDNSDASDPMPLLLPVYIGNRRPVTWHTSPRTKRTHTQRNLPQNLCAHAGTPTLWPLSPEAAAQSAAIGCLGLDRLDSSKGTQPTRHRPDEVSMVTTVGPRGTRLLIFAQ